ncbi:MAG: DNA recombination protein RmuC [Rhodospirillales bacterium]|nr:DNA recombination protein RmuC [Rhodospirillales bacterium]
MTIDWVSLMFGLSAGLLIAVAFLAPGMAALREKMRYQEKAADEMGSLFALSAQEALDKNSEQFLQRFSELAQEKMKQAQANSVHDLEKRQISIHEMVKPIQDQLKSLGSAIEQIKGTDQALKVDLQNLSRETARLTGALRDPAAQGRWGEFILEGLLDKSGLIKGVHYETQVTMDTAEGRQRPDAVIRLQDGFNIIIDAKAPLNEFAHRLAEDMSAEEHDALMQNLARQVRDHVRKLGRRGYWENIESPDFTVLFLPSEHMFSMTLRADPAIVDFAAENDIIIASPTLLMSLLRVVGLSWRQAELAENAQKISAQGAELYKRLLTFGSHFEKIGRSISGAMGSYNDAVGSLDRMVLPAARRLKELGVQSGSKDLPELSPLDKTPRGLMMAEGSGEEEPLKKQVNA